MTTVKQDLEEVLIAVECSPWAFPDKYAADGRFARILHPGDLAGITTLRIAAPCRHLPGRRPVRSKPAAPDTP
ncbi:hypothetical protein [Mycobacterium sp.]|uniref:hypothetical protein n=1 Tax=Mycobacterium sp. TaxID=1785 RepID=UPI0012725A2C|nr:hypothetical protein [Mycobacterium sp.]KAA8957722.1 MAG: hypothetical protein F6Q13_16140 [Mycobacterium sp.]